jgi:hypothetical protein
MITWIKSSLVIAISLLLVTVNLFGSGELLSSQENSDASANTEATFVYTDDGHLLTDGANEIDGMKFVYETASLELYTDIKNASVAIKQKSTGDVWYSNPVDLDKDTLAQGSSRFRLMSQLDIIAYDSQGQRKNYDNYTNSINKDQYKVERTSNGLKYTFTFGSKKKVDVLVPSQLGKIRFEEKFLNNPALSEDDLEDLLKQFRYDEQEELWFWKPTSSELLLNRLKSIYEKAGYTDEDYYKDMENVPAEEKEEELSVDIPVIYEINDDDFIARIPLSEIAMPDNWFLTNISFLENFGAAFEDSDGYMLVPDGSGALINFNKYALHRDTLFIELYGKDRSMDIRQQTDFSEQAVLPVFGVKNSDRAFLAIIEDADTFATINASRSGYLTLFNTIFANFNLTSKGLIRIGDGNLQTQVSAYQEKMYDGEIKIRYMFLSDDKADYQGMAEAYREYLLQKHEIRKLSADANIPFILETVGSIVKTKHFLGISYVGNAPLTRYEDNTKLLQMLTEKGVDNIDLRLSGWFNSGIDQDVAVKIELTKVLGGNKGFSELIEYCQNREIDIFPNVDFLSVNNKNGFSKYKSGARTIDQRFSKDYRYAPNTNYAMDYISKLVRGYRHVVSPSALDGTITKFVTAMNKKGVENLSLGDLGSKLSSDFKRNATIDRQTASEMISDGFIRLSDSAGKLMIEKGNSYALPYVDIVVNAPMDYSGFLMTDESIPFFQMVFHGLIEYSGKPLNVSSNYTKDMLKSVEYGCSVYYKWTYEDSSETKYTADQDLYNVSYTSKLDSAADFYIRANAVLKGVQNLYMVGYEKKDGLSIVTYEDGSRIVINYNSQPVVYEGTEILGENFTLLPGEEAS